MNNDGTRTESRPRQRFNKIDHFTVLLAAIGGVGSVLLLLRMATYGINLTDDSDLYISAARSLLEGDGFTIWTGQPYADRPPLYPLTLAFFSFSGLDVIKTAEYVNAISFGLTIFVIAMLLKSWIRSRFLIIWAASVCALSTQMAEFSARAGTEVLFILFVVASLFALNNFLRSGKKSLLFWAGSFTAAALLTRYIGVTLVVSGVLALLLAKNQVLRTRRANAAFFLIIATAPFSLWILRNIFTIGSLFGSVHTEGLRLIESLRNANNEIIFWILGETGFEIFGRVVTNIAGVAITQDTIESITITSAFLVYYIIGIGYIIARYQPGFLRRNINILSVTSLFVIVYFLFLAVERTLNDGLLSTRYLIPLFPVLLIIMVVAIDEFILKIRINRTIHVLLLSAYLLSLIVPNYNSIGQWNDTGRGYRSKEWQESEVIRYLNSDQLDGVIWSTDYAALYYSSVYAKEINRLPMTLEEAKARISGMDHYVVWFYWNVYFLWPMYSTNELGASLGLEVVAILKDGVILKGGTISDDDSVIWDRSFWTEALLTQTQLIIDSHYEVYIDDSFNRLIYVRQGPCTLSDIESKVYLQVFPQQSAELSEHRQQYVFDDLGFNFYEGIIPIRGYCIAAQTLPAYNIAAVRTGQRTKNGENLWEGRFTFS